MYSIYSVLGCHRFSLHSRQWVSCGILEKTRGSIICDRTRSLWRVLSQIKWAHPKTTPKRSGKEIVGYQYFSNIVREVAICYHYGTKDYDEIVYSSNYLYTKRWTRGICDSGVLGGEKYGWQYAHTSWTMEDRFQWWKIRRSWYFSWGKFIWFKKISLNEQK